MAEGSGGEEEEDEEEEEEEEAHHRMTVMRTLEREGEGRGVE